MTHGISPAMYKRLPKIFASQIIRETQNVDVSMHSLLFTPVLVVRKNISVLMLYGLVCILALAYFW